MGESDEERFEELMNKADLTERDLQKELNDYAQALRQEFELKQQDDPNNVNEFTRDFFRKNVAAASAQIVWLSNNSESDSVRLNAARFIVTVAREIEDSDADPIKKLLEELTANAANTPAE